MVVGRNNGVVGLTGFSDKEMSGLLFGPQKSGRKNEVVVLTGWSYGGVPLYNQTQEPINRLLPFLLNVWPGHFIISYTPLLLTSFLDARGLKFSDARHKLGAKKHSKKPVVYVAFIFNQKRKDRSISLSFQRRKDDIFKHGRLD